MKFLLFAVAFVAVSNVLVSPLCRLGPRRHRNCKLLPRDDQCSVVRVQRREVGGHDASPGQFPWLALIYTFNSDSAKIVPHCGGSVINDRYIITAAHCRKENVTLIVRVGEHDLSSAVDCPAFGGGGCGSRSQDFEVESMTSHPKYNADPLPDYDLCLIRLKKKMGFNGYIYPICLPMDGSFREEETLMERQLEEAGWGVDRQESGKNNYPDVLQTATVPYVPRHQCKQWRRFLSPTKICAGGQEGQGSCEGDSGGPLMGRFSPRGTRDRYFLIGVVSFGPALCSEVNLPHVYANVAELMSWVLDSIY